jgi:tetratricopeptide (TPR) repeat protein
VRAAGFDELRIVALARGRFRDAATALERALALSENLDIRVWPPILASDLGQAYTWRGRIEDAVPLVERGAAVGGDDEPRRLSQLAVGYSHAGNAQDALRAGERALAMAVQMTGPSATIAGPARRSPRPGRGGSPWP